MTSKEAYTASKEADSAEVLHELICVRRLLGITRVAVCCSVMHCVAVCCSVLQCVAVCCALCVGLCETFPWRHMGYSVLQCVTVCCSVLQCVAVCCSVMQCVVACVVELSVSLCAMPH